MRIFIFFLKVRGYFGSFGGCKLGTYWRFLVLWKTHIKRVPCILGGKNGHSFCLLVSPPAYRHVIGWGGGCFYRNCCVLFNLDRIYLIEDRSFQTYSPVWWVTNNVLGWGIWTEWKWGVMEREVLMVTVVENGGPSLKSPSRGMCPPSFILWDSVGLLCYWIMRNQAS